MFPAPDGISKVISPWTILTGLTLGYNLHCRLEFSTYVQVHKQHDNSMAAHSTGALAIHPFDNSHGGYYCFSLSTQCLLHHNWGAVLLMPSEVVDCIHGFTHHSEHPDGLHLKLVMAPFQTLMMSGQRARTTCPTPLWHLPVEL